MSNQLAIFAGQIRSGGGAMGLTMRRMPRSRIPIWESRRRLGELKAFRADVTEYFERASRPARRSRRPGAPGQDENEVSAVRRRINRRANEVERIVHGAGVNDSVSYSAQGFSPGHIPIIANIFSLHQYHVSHATAIDFIDRAIGNYEYDLSSAWVRTVNPFYWLGLLLELAVRLPFRAAARAGFDAQRFENSLAGRLLKLLLYIVTGLAAVLGSLQLLGWLQPVLDLLNFPMGPGGTSKSP